ncbi:hypothetical protein I3J13_22700 [Agrobacterium sp. MOPV5]|uniref:hypothetical protein n=1 Tax=Agrobacterium leguminum TaxID=2792015 RepID=UPI0018C2FA83|nr:hypothetical protein [Agrobacterium leguminum]MBG0511595.1 hypothetical protein [Agrobacterium leguminum]
MGIEDRTQCWLVRDLEVCVERHGSGPAVKSLNLKKVEAAMKLIEAQTLHAEAGRQSGLGRSTVYSEMRRLGNIRP